MIRSDGQQWRSNMCFNGALALVCLWDRLLNQWKNGAENCEICSAESHLVNLSERPFTNSHLNPFLSLSVAATARRTISQGSSTDKSPARLELLHATGEEGRGGNYNYNDRNCNWNCNSNSNRKTTHHTLQRSFGKQLWKSVQTNNSN